MNNADKPAMAIWTQDMNLGETSGSGLTKREQACLTMGVADTGDAELDAIITKGNKNKFAGLAMQGLMADEEEYRQWSDLAKDSVAVADALLKQLEQDND
tara:strand:- start:926 stop:1225 length:300 start_codon:yes stop_codon:yes gene_type:complete